MRFRRVATTAAVLVGMLTIAWLGASLFMGSKTLATTTPGQKWEYRVMVADVPVTSWSSEGLLNDSGREGWELVSAVNESYEIYDIVLTGMPQTYTTVREVVFVFKRPLP